jgi:hypothetical protein
MFARHAVQNRLPLSHSTVLHTMKTTSCVLYMHCSNQNGEGVVYGQAEREASRL